MSSVASTSDMTDLTWPDRADCVVTPCYCEENVWLLAKSLLEKNARTPDFKCYVVVLSNPNKCVHLWKQITDMNAFSDGLTFWDYHVFIIVKHKNQTLVFDLNSTMSFPVPFDQYAKESIKHDFPDVNRYFKVINAQMYVDKFSSDREHMLEGADRWLAPPPDYPPILNKEKRNNLENIISMDPSNIFGPVYGVNKFIKLFS